MSLLALPFGLGKDLVTAVLKGTLKVGMGLLKFIPIQMIKDWKIERTSVQSSAQSARDALAKTIG